MFRRILWAVEPIVQDVPLQRKLIDSLPAIASDAASTVEPVEVQPGDLMAFTVGDEVEERREFWRLLGADLLRSPLTVVLPPALLEALRPGGTAQVESLLRHADRCACDLVAAATHARRGLERLLLGSFVDKLLYRSPVPLLIVNPETRISTRVSDILFPCDFTATVRAFYDRILPAAADWRARITLLHKVKPPRSPESFSSFELGPISSDPLPELERLRVTAEEKAAPWLAEARAASVEVRCEIDDTAGTLTDSILARASALEAPLIAMVSHVSAIESFLLGSTVKTIVRSARCPVLVLHDTYAESAGRAAA